MINELCVYLVGCLKPLTYKFCSLKNNNKKRLNFSLSFFFKSPNSLNWNRVINDRTLCFPDPLVLALDVPECKSSASEQLIGIKLINDPSWPFGSARAPPPFPNVTVLRETEKTFSLSTWTETGTREKKTEANSIYSSSSSKSIHARAKVIKLAGMLSARPETEHPRLVFRQKWRGNLFKLNRKVFGRSGHGWIDSPRERVGQKQGKTFFFHFEFVNSSSSRCQARNFNGNFRINLWNIPRPFRFR